MTEVLHNCEGAYTLGGADFKIILSNLDTSEEVQVEVLGIELTNIGHWNIKFEVLHVESTFLVDFNLKVDISAIKAVENLIIEH